MPPWLGATVGGLMGLSLIKFGNPVILDRHVPVPSTILEWVFNSWPVSWAYACAAVVTSVTALLFVTRRPSRSSGTPSGRTRRAGTAPLRPEIEPLRFYRLLRYLGFAPLVWFGWQCVAATRTVDIELTRVTLWHFAAAVACFYVGWFGLSQLRDLRSFWMGVLIGFVAMLWAGFDQWFGGLEASRQMLYATPGWEQYPPELLRRIASERVFGTLFYPNALAGAILLLFPPLLWFLLHLTASSSRRKLPSSNSRRRLQGSRSNIIRGTVIGLFCYGSVACLYWSGSKAGWLIAVILLVVASTRVKMAPRLRWTVAGLVFLIALVVFAIRFSDYFHRGATSAVARMDYWRAAWTTAVQNPLTGTGPGTFQVPYRAVKSPESEMAKLTHNDYLQQASDGGLPGMVLYTGFILVALGTGYGLSRREPARFALWIGLFGFAVHSGVEFGLYIPALAWPAFALFGWLIAAPPEDLVVAELQNRLDTSGDPSYSSARP
jgi:hypothetical protein